MSGRKRKRDTSADKSEPSANKDRNVTSEETSAAVTQRKRASTSTKQTTKKGSETREQLLDEIADYIPMDILEDWPTSRIRRFKRAKYNQHFASEPVKAAWTDIEEVIGEGYKYPFRIQMYFWSDAYYGERLILMAFVYINGLNPELLYDFLSARNMRNNKKRIRHYRSIANTFEKDPQRYKDLYGFHVTNRRYEKVSGEIMKYVGREERRKMEMNDEAEADLAKQYEIDDDELVHVMEDFESAAAEKLSSESDMAEQDQDSSAVPDHTETDGYSQEPGELKLNPTENKAADDTEVIPDTDDEDDNAVVVGDQVEEKTQRPTQRRLSFGTFSFMSGSTLKNTQSSQASSEGLSEQKTPRTDGRTDNKHLRLTTSESNLVLTESDQKDPCESLMSHKETGLLEKENVKEISQKDKESSQPISKRNDAIVNEESTLTTNGDKDFVEQAKSDCTQGQSKTEFVTPKRKSLFAHKDTKLIRDLSLPPHCFIKTVIVQDASGTQQIFSGIDNISLISSKSVAKTIIIQLRDIDPEPSDMSRQDQSQHDLPPTQPYNNEIDGTKESEAQDKLYRPVNPGLNTPADANQTDETSVSPIIQEETSDIGRDIKSTADDNITEEEAMNLIKSPSGSLPCCNKDQPIHSSPKQTPHVEDYWKNFPASAELFSQMEKEVTENEVINSGGSIDESVNASTVLPNGQVVFQNVAPEDSETEEILNTEHIGQGLANITINNCDDAKYLCPAITKSTPDLYGLFHTCATNHDTNLQQNQLVDLPSTYPIMKKKAKKEILVGLQEHTQYLETLNDIWLAEYDNNPQSAQRIHTPARQDPVHDPHVLTQHIQSKKSKKHVRFNDEVHIISAEATESTHISEKQSEITGARRRQLIRSRLTTKKERDTPYTTQSAAQAAAAPTQIIHEDDSADIRSKKTADGPPIVHKVY